MADWPQETSPGCWKRVQEDGCVDTSTYQIAEHEKPALRFDDAALRLMTQRVSYNTIDKVPGFAYWRMSEERCMDRPVNITGHQERAFEYYWALRAGLQRSRIVLGIGTSCTVAPCMLGTDKFCGVSPDEGRYGKEYGFPHLKVDADERLPFFDGKFGGVIAIHALEHLKDTGAALREWLRVTEPEGYICILQPDITFCARGSIDPTHVREFSADEFLAFVRSLNLPALITEHNTLDNRFSFNTVLQHL